MSEAVDRLLAYEEIRQLAARYALAVDSRDLDALVALFVDDVRVGRDATGRAALRQFFDTSLRAIGVSRLSVTTHVIDLQGPDDATGSVYCDGEIADGDRWIRQAILYRDTYARREGRWLFVRRDHQLWYGLESPSNPLQQPPADWPERHDGRGTVPECWDSWRVFWAPSD